MARAPVGQRIRKRRQELGQSQMAVAGRVGISPSYLNLIEHNKRAIGGALMNRIAEALSLDSRALAGTEEARLIAELGEVAADAVLIGGDLKPENAGELVAASPAAARAILGLYRAYQDARLRSDLLGERLGDESFLAEASHQMLALITTIRSYSEILKDYGDLSEAERGRFIATLVDESERLAARAGDMFDFLGGRGARRPRPSPREEIEDFLSDRANYFPRIEQASEKTLATLDGAATVESLAAYLRRRHRISCDRRPPADLPISGERHDHGTFLFSSALGRGSVRFRLARLIGSLEHGGLLDELVAGAGPVSADAPARLRNALANYFAAALLMPYAPFRQAADDTRFDINRLGIQFDASFEQVSHRLVTLRRPGAEGIPMHFMRSDIAGNVSKRFSASGLRLPRYGGTCPRWIIHDAFAWPGRIVTQVGQLSDGDTYFFIARTTGWDGTAGTATPRHAVMIGASIAHAGRFAYADGIDLAAPRVMVPIGITCRQCPRMDCTHRAFDRAPVPAPGASVT